MHCALKFCCSGRSSPLGHSEDLRRQQYVQHIKSKLRISSPPPKPAPTQPTSTPNLPDPFNSFTHSARSAHPPQPTHPHTHPPTSYPANHPPLHPFMRCHSHCAQEKWAQMQKPLRVCRYCGGWYYRKGNVLLSLLLSMRCKTNSPGLWPSGRCKFTLNHAEDST